MSATMRNDVAQVARAETLENPGTGSEAREAPVIAAAAEDAAVASKSAPTPEEASAKAAAGAVGPAPRSGRDEHGRFLPGHPGGPGNPFAREVARLRKRIMAKLTDEKFDA